MRRGTVWLAELNPVKGSEQAGYRPVIVFQQDAITPFNRTVIAIPLSTNLARVALPTCVLIPKGEAGLSNDSVALCHQVRALDKTRLNRELGMLSDEVLADVERCMLFTMGYL